MQDTFARAARDDRVSCIQEYAARDDRVSCIQEYAPQLIASRTQDQDKHTDEFF